MTRAAALLFGATVSAAACGGNVVVDDSTGTGGATGTGGVSGNGGATTSTGTETTSSELTTSTGLVDAGSDAPAPPYGVPPYGLPPYGQPPPRDGG
jgi:hypothetical protein